MRPKFSVDSKATAAAQIAAALAHIALLEQDLATSDGDLTAARAQVKDLDTLKASVATLQGEKATLEKAVADGKALLATRDTELATAKAAVAAFDGKVKEAAALAAKDIVAKLGVPPVAGAPAADPTKTQAPEASGLKGHARVAAAFSAKLQK